MTRFYFLNDDPGTRVVKGMGDLRKGDGRDLIAMLKELGPGGAIHVDLTRRPSHGNPTLGVEKVHPGGLRALRDASDYNKEANRGLLTVFVLPDAFAELQRQGAKDVPWLLLDPAE